MSNTIGLTIAVGTSGVSNASDEIAKLESDVDNLLTQMGKQNSEIAKTTEALETQRATH